MSEILTRLKPTDVQLIPTTLTKYEKELINKTGCTLLELAENAAQRPASIKTVCRKTKAAVVPISSGLGVIEGFSQAVAAILNHIGIKTMITREDVEGVAEAYEHGVDVILVANDTKFVAINLHTRRVVDNAASTAKAYVAALDKMANGLEGREVLVIGVGSVGSTAVIDLIRRKARPLVVDIDKPKLRAFVERYRHQVVPFSRLDEAIRHTNLIINAAPARNILKVDMINENTFISAPAIPIGLTPAALKKVNRNLVHDPLQLGVATMAVDACAN